MTSYLKTHTIFFIYLVGFLFAFHVALPAYINSSFVGSLVTDQLVGLIYTVGSIITILGFIFLPSILNRIGNYNTSVGLLLLEMLATLALSLFQNPVTLVIFFLLSFIIVPFIYFSLDIFLEGFSSNHSTGEIRGTYLSLGNIAWVLGPLVASLVLLVDNYQTLYFLSFLLLLPLFFIVLFGLRKFKDSRYQVMHTIETVNKVWHNKDLKDIFMANFLLQFFYSWMVIYTPIYLHETIGLPWPVIGIIFSIMLLPFVITEYPLGRLSDKKWGEKEMLIIGFVIIALATAGISFVYNQNVILWTALLFATRIGASMIEIMCESYFFKKVNNLNTNMISLFRISRPAAYILGPLVATILLNLFDLDLRYLFVVLGAIMLLGLKFSFNLKDTK